jgi:dimethylhistidine N-methyltransferase
MNDPRPTSSTSATPVDLDFARSVVEGLGSQWKTLPCRFFYDARGSELFEEITELDAYYPTRTEIGILTDRAREIAARTQPGTVMVEYGSGSSRKTELLLAEMATLAAYVPIDVSASALAEAQARLKERFPKLRIEPIEGDFRAPLHLPPDLTGAPRLGFFPGSTIGNFERAEACSLLASMAKSLGQGARLIVGVDLEKDLVRLHRAYDDEKGVTAAFNKNLLVRINHELGGDFDLDGFRHRAVWNQDEHRIEMHLVSARTQVVQVLGHRFTFNQGESIHTENSHKYTVARFRALAQAAGWSPAQVWLDEERLFSLHELVAI